MNYDYELDIIMTKILCLKYSGYINQGVTGWVPQKADSEMKRKFIKNCSWDHSEREGKEVGLGRRRSWATVQSEERTHHTSWRAQKLDWT